MISTLKKLTIAQSSRRVCFAPVSNPQDAIAVAAAISYSHSDERVKEDSGSG